MLRTVTSSDITKLCALEKATQADPWSREVFEKCFQAKSLGWVIDPTADKVTGFILILLQLNECHILNICVDPSLQRQGYGTQLLSHALMEAKQQGAEIVYLEVRRSNEKAIALYQKMGFEKMGERKDYYLAAGGREDAWVFARKL